jgi:threonine synthase
LVETGQLDADAETLLLNTGDGLKTLDVVPGGPSATIVADLDDFTATVHAARRG